MKKLKNHLRKYHSKAPEDQIVFLNEFENHDGVLASGSLEGKEEEPRQRGRERDLHNLFEKSG